MHICRHMYYVAFSIKNIDIVNLFVNSSFWFLMTLNLCFINEFHQFK